MRTALEWIEAESAKQNPQTQDIAPWMETSFVGSIPVPSIASTHPPTHVSSSHPAGRILSTSGVRAIPVEPIVIEEIDPNVERRWVQIVLLLLLLGTLAVAGYWYDAQQRADESLAPLGLEPSAEDAE